jgi:hypothetical protein
MLSSAERTSLDNVLKALDTERDNSAVAGAPAALLCAVLAEEVRTWVAERVAAPAGA